eukprot:CAMPEP_0173116750 /NCGR_PEP_ID=MMETSP1102-20130122/49639_1 /TAXON_ID=49646 /ORGANISM="Geminigera sp., Strain Caron Lab Isolate" /LENGTH=32 /DNA_ID= /DNA_START= /DNA_END= /DNA_ORIENTATION=
MAMLGIGAKLTLKHLASAFDCLPAPPFFEPHL